MLLVLALVRAAVLVPALGVTATQMGSPVAAMCALTVLLGLSNGYLTALTMTLAPSFTSSRGLQGVVGGDQTSNRGSMVDSTAEIESLVRGSDPEQGGCHGDEEEDASLAEELCVLCLIGGLSTGALLSWFWLLFT